MFPRLGRRPARSSPRLPHGSGRIAPRCGHPRANADAAGGDHSPRDREDNYWMIDSYRAPAIENGPQINTLARRLRQPQVCEYAIEMVHHEVACVGIPPLQSSSELTVLVRRTTGGTRGLIYRNNE